MAQDRIFYGVVFDLDKVRSKRYYLTDYRHTVYRSIK